jgi:hypothetical protein
MGTTPARVAIAWLSYRLGWLASYSVRLLDGSHGMLAACRRRKLCCRSEAAITDYLLLETLSVRETDCRPRRAVADRTKVSGLSLPKTGVFAEMVGDFRHFARPVRPIGSVETESNARKPAVSHPYAKVLRSQSLTYVWRRRCLSGLYPVCRTCSAKFSEGRRILKIELSA